MKIYRILFVLSLMLTVVLSSCKQKSGDQKSSEAAEIGTEEMSEMLMKINPALRDPSILMSALDMAGAEYMEGIITPLENVGYYAQDEALAAIMLGIFTVDIAYLVSYGMTDQAMVKYERARKLADAIGLQTSYEQGVFEDYLAAGGNPDSLRKHLTMTAENVDKELSEGDRTRLVTLYVTGEFIEKMYLVTEVINRYPTDLPEDARSQLLRHLMVGVANQEEPLDNLISLLDHIRKEGEGERFMKEMNILKGIYTEANFSEMIANWTPGYMPTGNYIKQISEQVTRIRTELMAIEE